MSDIDVNQLISNADLIDFADKEQLKDDSGRQFKVNLTLF